MLFENLSYWSYVQYMYVLVHDQGSMRVEHSVIRNFNIQDEYLPRKNVKGDSFYLL